MKKRIVSTILCIFLFISVFAQYAFANTRVEVIKPSYAEDSAVSVSYKDGQPPLAEYVYTGQNVKPEVVVKKMDGTIAKPSEYKITYEDDCAKAGLHTVTVEYLKSGYVVRLDYLLVPGTTKRVDMSAKNGKVTLSWSSVPGATCYRVYKFDSSTGKRAEVYWEDGSIAAPKTSRTLTDLEPGKTYTFGIMALLDVGSMPTKQIKTFKFTVPESGEGSFNIIPGINEAPIVTTTKQATTVKATEKMTTTVPQTSESTTAVETTQEETTELTTLKEETSKTTTEKTTTKASVEDVEEEHLDVWKIVPIFAAIVAVIVASVLVVIKKKKNKV